MSWRSYRESGDDENEQDFFDRSVAVTVLPEDEEEPSVADTMRETIVAPTNRRWYPGKFLGFKKRDSNSSLKGVERDGSTDSGGDNAQKQRPSWFRASFSGNKKDTTSNDKQDTQSTDGEYQNEKLFVQIVRNIRNKIIARQIAATIYFHRVSGVISTALTCEVKETDEASVEVPFERADYSFELNRAITMTDTILNSLERRSRAWTGVDFLGEVSITRGGYFAITAPFVGIMGFSFTMEITATVKSLLASRKRLEIARAAAPRSSFSLSFSFMKSQQAIDSDDDDTTGKSEQEKGSFESDRTLDNHIFKLNGSSNFTSPFAVTEAEERQLPKVTESNSETEDEDESNKIKDEKGKEKSVEVAMDVDTEGSEEDNEEDESDAW